MNSPLMEIDQNLIDLFENHGIIKEACLESHIMWLKYPTLIDWLGYYIVSEYFSEECPLPVNYIPLKIVQESFLSIVEHHSYSNLLYIMMKCMYDYYKSNWIMLAQETSGVTQ